MPPVIMPISGSDASVPWNTKLRPNAKPCPEISRQQPTLSLAACGTLPLLFRTGFEAVHFHKQFQTHPSSHSVYNRRFLPGV